MESSSHSLAEQAYQLLNDQLVTLELAPGQVLAEQDLVDSTGIGRTPVREAIQRLAAEGLLKIIPRKGLMVTNLQRSDLNRVMEARKVLERLMVVKATERASYIQRQVLNSLATSIASAGDDREIVFRHIASLEQLLGEACDNRYLPNALKTMRGQCSRLSYLQAQQVDLSSWASNYVRLARAVADGEGAGAIRAMDEIIAALENLVSGLDVFS